MAFGSSTTLVAGSSVETWKCVAECIHSTPYCYFTHYSKYTAEKLIFQIKLFLLLRNVLYQRC